MSDEDTMDKIIRAVCGMMMEAGYNILPEMITGKYRGKHLVRARHMVAFIAYQHYDFTLKGAAALLNRDHASVVHANRQMADLIDRYAEHGRLYMAVTEELGLRPLEWLKPCVFEKLQEVKKLLKNPLDKPKKPVESDSYVVPLNYAPGELEERRWKLKYPGVARGYGDTENGTRTMTGEGISGVRREMGRKTYKRMMNVGTVRHFKRATTKDAIFKEMKRQGRR